MKCPRRCPDTPTFVLLPHLTTPTSSSGCREAAPRCSAAHALDATHMAQVSHRTHVVLLLLWSLLLVLL